MYLIVLKVEYLTLVPCQRLETRKSSIFFMFEQDDLIISLFDFLLVSTPDSNKTTFQIGPTK